MHIKNNTTVTLVAYGWQEGHRLGDDVVILPGTSSQILGPSLGFQDGREFYVSLLGNIICNDTDPSSGFYIQKGLPVFFSQQDRGCTIRHIEDPRPEHKMTNRTVPHSYQQTRKGSRKKLFGTGR